MNVPVNAFKLKAVFVKCLSLLIRDSLFVVSHRLPVTSLGHQLPELLRNVLKIEKNGWRALVSCVYDHYPGYLQAFFWVSFLVFSHEVEVVRFVGLSCP